MTVVGMDIDLPRSVCQIAHALSYNRCAEATTKIIITEFGR